jgi:plastocyanin
VSARPAVVCLSSLLLALGASCHRGEPRPAGPTALDGGAFGTGAVRGKVTFHGVPPPAVSRPTRSSFPDCSRLPAPQGDPSLRLDDAGEVGEAFVWVKEGLPSGVYLAPETPVTLDQHDCEFVPRVFGVQLGQQLRLVNSDPLLHNVHTATAFNVPMPNQGMTATRVFGHPGVMNTVVCDVHGWMRAYAGVVSHPFFAVTAADGTYAIERLPTGHYTVEVWQERLGRKSREVTLGVGESGTLDFDMTPN